MLGPSVHTSNGQASSRQARHVHVWELSRSLAERCTVRVLAARDCVSPVADTRCAQLRLARRRCRAHACPPARLARSRHVHMWALPRILAERYHDTVRVQTCSHACDLSSTCAHVPAGLLHLHALSLRFHTARVHTHATCARWLENSPLTIACRASPMPGRCVHACLARLLMSSLSCIPAFSPNVVCVQDSIFCAILHVINLYK